MTPDVFFERILEYFQGSRFDYLALDYAGGSIRLSRDVPGVDSGAAHNLEVRASTVGFVERPAGRERLPRTGDPVSANEPIFAIRRFRDVIPIAAPASGALQSVLVSEGDFVEFGQALATLYTN